MSKVSVFILLTLFIILLCIYLGTWQLSRANEKRQLIEKSNSHIEISVVDWQAAIDSQIMTLNGQYETEKYFLLDNQSYEGQVGYDVLVPFNVKRLALTFMVNLGWVKASTDRSVLPQVILPTNEVQIKVRVYQPTKKTFRLSDNQYANADWPKRIQYFSTDYIAQEMINHDVSTKLAPYETRIESGQPGEKIRHWNYYQMSPEKHIAYAVQWFSLATVLCFFAGYFFYKNNKVESGA